MHIQILAIAVGLATGTVASFSDDVIKPYPEWQRWQHTRICLEKQHNPNYYHNACLSTSPYGEKGRLGMDSDLFGVSPTNSINYTETPIEGKWYGLLDIGPEHNRQDFSQSAPREYTFIIFSSPDQCLTWQKYPREAALEKIMNGIGKNFTNYARSTWLGDIYFDKCSFGDVDIYSKEAFPFDFSKFADNQKFLVVADGTEQEPDNDVVPRKRRIIPKVSGDDPKTIDLCDGKIGIFDRMETGYRLSRVGGHLNRTTIGWGCTNQVWSLRWQESDTRKSKALSHTIGIGGLAAAGL
ncbi:hypothetical protein TWF730_011137 [Orbilia blumenaviensis]|uniref:Uncharacterized protein n=1 Tax=Orbilia blumenaviensis TaxID=1796055 RepID=A0AAV9UN91_9PEZI